MWLRKPSNDPRTLCNSSAWAHSAGSSVWPTEAPGAPRRWAAWGPEAFAVALGHGFAFRLRVLPVGAAAQAEPWRGLWDRRRRKGNRHHRRAEQRDVADRARHDADCIQRLGVDPHAGRRKQPETRLAADDPATPGRAGP